MISYRTQTKLGQLIENLAINNRKLEVQRQILAEQSQFEPYTTFKRLDCLRKGSIDQDDIVNFMHDNGIYINRSDAQKVIDYLDVNQNSIVSYTEFSKQILPKEHTTLKQVASSRQPYPLTRYEKLEYEVEWSLTKILQQLIRSADDKIQLLSSLQDSHDYNARECFMTIDQLDRGTINSLQLDKFFNKCDIFISDEEFDSFFALVDVNHNGLITYREFISQVLTVDNVNKSISHSLNRSINRSTRLDRSNRLDRSINRSTRLDRSINRSINRSTRFDRSMNKSMNRSSRLDRSMNKSINRSTRLDKSMNRSSRLDKSMNKSKRMNDMDLNQEYREYTATKRSFNQSLYITPSKYATNRSMNKSLSKSMSRSMNRSPLKATEQYQLIKALKQQIEIDKEIEDDKKSMSLKSDFNLLDGFRMLDLEGKGFVSSSEFRQALYEMGVSVSKDEAYLVFKRYDKDNDGLLKYSDFCRMVAPVNRQYSDILKSKEPTYNNRQILSWESKRGLKRLLNLVINGELQSEILRQQLQSRPSFNAIDAFDSLDRNENGFITPTEFRCMLENYGVYVSSKDVQVLLNRYDKNNDGRVSYSEFCNEILPKSPKKL